MRQYSVVFMEQGLGAQRLTAVPGAAGADTFQAADDEAALAYITEHLLDRLKQCARADMSSLRIVEESSTVSGYRLVDDTHASPQFQDVYVKYDAVTQRAQADWESTRTVILMG